jgi:hypothetical protein
MSEPPNTRQSRLKPWVLPLGICALAAIVLGVLATYADRWIGAGIVVIGLCGLAVVAVQASRSVDHERDGK